MIASLRRLAVLLSVLACLVMLAAPAAAAGGADMRVLGRDAGAQPPPLAQRETHSHPHTARPALQQFGGGVGRVRAELE